MFNSIQSLQLDDYLLNSTLNTHRTSLGQERVEGVGEESITAGLQGEKHLIWIFPNDDLNSFLEKAELNLAVVGLYDD